MAESPKISFYPLQQPGDDAVILFACRLVEKAWQRDHRIHLLCRSAQQGQLLDTMLWQFRPEAFIPHQLIIDDTKDLQPGVNVTLGLQNAMPDQPDMLINLTGEVWARHDQFKDIREIVGANEEDRQKGRQCYREYQNLGYSPQTLKL